MVKLFISGFPLDIDEMQLAQLVGPYGEIDTIKIVRDKKTRVCKGYAFIEMKNEEAVTNAISALNGQMFGDRELTVRPAIAKVAAPTSFYKKIEKPNDPFKKKRPRKLL